LCHASVRGCDDIESDAQLAVDVATTPYMREECESNRMRERETETETERETEHDQRAVGVATTPSVREECVRERESERDREKARACPARC